MDKVWRVVHSSINLFNCPTGLAYKTRQRIREGYCGSTFTDGEIFRQIRLSHFQKDHVKASRWMARLSPSKARDLRALVKRDVLMKALDSILAFRGLWVAFKLGSMDVFATLRCDEVWDTLDVCSRLLICSHTGNSLLYYSYQVDLEFHHR